MAVVVVVVEGVRVVVTEDVVEGMRVGRLERL